MKRSTSDVNRWLGDVNRWLPVAALMVVLFGSSTLAAQRAVPRGNGGGGQAAAPAPSSQDSAPAPQGARPSGGSRDSGRTASPPAERTSGSSSDGSNVRSSNGDSGSRAVPYGRPRESSANGVAVARTSPPPTDGNSRRAATFYYPVGYYPWGYGGYGFGGYYAPSYYGLGYFGSSYYGGGFYDGFYDPWGSGYARNYSLAFADDGALRLKIKPNHASVFVDGYFAGQVDDFDGLFQRLHIGPGPHHIEVREEGYEPLFFDVRILSDRTVTYSGALKKQ
jgi:hypothetical protein